MGLLDKVRKNKLILRRRARIGQDLGMAEAQLVEFCCQDLGDFLLRARVLNLYRQALRTVRRAPVHARAELRDIVRQEMENNRNCNDKQKIRFFISDGLQRLKGLDETLDMQGRC